MCGIGGVLMFPKERSEGEMSYIRELVKNLALYNQARGRDATGFVSFSNVGIVLRLSQDAKVQLIALFVVWLQAEDNREVARRVPCNQTRPRTGIPPYLIALAIV